MLDPDVVLRVDRGACPRGASREVRGAEAVAAQAGGFAALAPLGPPGARQRRGRVRRRPRRPRRSRSPAFTVAGGRIVEIDLLADPDRLRELDLTIL